MTFAKRPDGSLYQHGDPLAVWDYSPLYEELVALPLLIYIPGVRPGAYTGLTSAIDVMPTVLDILGVPVPEWVQGRSLLPLMRDPSAKGREFVVSTIPFANPGDEVSSVDNISRRLRSPLMTTVTAGDWSLTYTQQAGRSELYNLKADPGQGKNVIGTHPETARELHGLLVRFMRENHMHERLVKPRLELRL